MKINKLFTYDFRNINFKQVLLLLIPIVVVLFGVYDIFLDTGKHYVRFGEKILNNPDSYGLGEYPSRFKYIFWGLTVFLGVYITVVAYLSYKKLFETEGVNRTLSISVSHALTNIIDLAFSGLVLYLIGVIFFFTTGHHITEGGFFVETANKLTDFYNNSVPTIVNLPYLVAFILVLLLTDLQAYIFHRLTHESRFLWYVSHRVHHSAEIMHPIGTGPVFGLGFLYNIPIFLYSLLVSKFFFEDSLALELLLYQLLFVLTEKFNHATPFYESIVQNKFLKFIFHITGNGPYHYMHHSAHEGEEVNNIGSTLFLFWDRVFGTYLAPRDKKPAVGLTNQPEIILNPFMLYFGGFLKIGYELKHNPITDWFKIIFGSVYYQPKNTKDYLIVGYKKEAKPQPY